MTTRGWRAARRRSNDNAKPRPALLDWTAKREDGIGHARRRHAPRTLCGLIALDPRFGWPEESRCTACVRLAGPYEQETAP